MRQACLAVCLVIGGFGCGRGGDAKKGKVTEGSIDPTKNPIAASQEIADEATRLAKEVESMKPVDPVQFQKLIDVLPPAPAGFKAEKPRGENVAFNEFKHAFAERRYSGGDDKSLEVKIHDGAGIKELYMGLAMASKFKRETSEGYDKGVTIDGNPGVEKYQNDSKRGDLSVIVGKRFIVSIETRGMPADFARTVYGTINTKKLAELK